MTTPVDAPPAQAGTGRGLARGSLTVAFGLGVTGLATLAMIALVNNQLTSKAEADAFNQWWLITTLLITPFGVFEAYLARLVVAERAAGRDPASVIGNLIGRTWMLAGAVSVGVLCLGPWLASAEFGDHLGLVLLLPVWVFVLATQAAQRGVATGRVQFGAIALQLSTDGALRIGLTAAVLLAGGRNVDVLAGATCVAATAGIVVAGLRCPGWFVRPTRTAVDVSWRPILLLLVASVCPVLAGNGPAPWLNAVYHHQHKDTAIAFADAVLLSRIPTQFVSAAFGPLLSHLTHAVETGDLRSFQRLRRLSELAAVVTGAVFVAAFTVVGAWFLPHFSNTPHGQLSDGTLAVLALASSLMFVAVVQQAGLAAMAHWGTIASAWAVALVSLAVVLVLPATALWRATAAPAAAIATALAIMAVMAKRSEQAQPA